MPVFTAIGTSFAAALGLSGLTATFVGGLTAAGLQIAAGIGLSLIAQNLMGGNKTSGFSVQGQLRSGSTVPRSALIGYYATAGSLVYWNEWGEVDNTPNAYSTRVIALSDVPIQSIVEYWVNDEKVTLDVTPHADYGYPVLEYRKDGVDHLWFKFYNGTQVTADAFLVSKFSTHPERPITSNFKGTGIAYVIATSLVEDVLFSDGFPSFKFAVNGMKLYDPTDVGQDPDNQATWGGDGDFLTGVQLYNLFKGIYYNGNWQYGIQNLSLTRLPLDNWETQIEKCRALIAGPDGNEATYRSGAEIFFDAPLSSTIEAFLTACQGKISEVGGTYNLQLGEPDAPSFYISDDDIITTEEQSFTPFFGLADTVNGIAATYPEPNEGWAPKAAPSLNDLDLEEEDGNRRLMVEAQLDLVPYAGQVQRLMRSALLEARRARRHTFTLPPKFWSAEPGDFFSYSSERNGYENKLFRIDGVADKSNLDVVIDATEVDNSDYDWNQGTDYTTPVFGPTTRVKPEPQPIVSFDVTAVAIPTEGGADYLPGIFVEVDQDLTDVVWVNVQIRYDGDTLPFYDRFLPYVSSDATFLISENIAYETSYQVRAKYIANSNRDTVWTIWEDVLTTSIDGGGGYPVNVGDFTITDGTNISQPFIFEDDVPVMVAARIGTIEAGRMLSPDGKFDINLTDKYIYIES